MAQQHPFPALCFGTLGAYQRTEALRAAIELDLFSIMAAGRPDGGRDRRGVRGLAAGLGGVRYDNDKLDRVSEKHGWRRVNEWSSIFRHHSDHVDSIRHGIRLNFVKGDLDETLTAESRGDVERWAKPLLTVSTRTLRTYGGPPPLEAR